MKSLRERLIDLIERTPEGDDRQLLMELLESADHMASRLSAQTDDEPERLGDALRRIAQPRSSER